MNLTRWLSPVVFAPLVFAQSAPQRLEFEVASVRESAPLTADVKIGVHIDGAQVKFNSLALKDYVQSAYNLKNYQVVGPDFIASLRFDIAAKLPEGGKREQVNEMLKSLLEDRFKMKTHRETKEFPVYGLVVTKAGLKLKEVDAVSSVNKEGVNVLASGSQHGVNLNYGNGTYLNFSDGKLEGRRLPMDIFCDVLARFMDRPVVDMTELKGTYDIDLQFSPEDYQAMLLRSAVAAGYPLPPQVLKLIELSSGDSLNAAMAKQGLKMESRKAPLPVVVVDRMEKMPTEN